MICLCTKDAVLAACADLYAGKKAPRQVSEIPQLKNQTLTAEDILIFDLKWFSEEDLPQLDCPVMVLVEVPDFTQAMRLMRGGVRGYGNRHMRAENLAQAIAAVQAGQVWMPPAIVNRMIASVASAEPEENAADPLEPLSRREKEVARWVAQGLSNRELAEKLHISVRTVKAHLTSIFSKTGFRDRLELAIRMKNR